MSSSPVFSQEQITENVEAVVRLGELNVLSRPGQRDCSGTKCLEPPQDFIVSKGNLIPHPSYEKLESNIINDIGLILLPQPAQLNEGVHPACLPEADQNSTNVKGTILGWGFTSPKTQAFKILEKIRDSTGVATIPESHQQKAELTVLENRKCGTWPSSLTGGMRPTQMCAWDSSAAACRGDSGGPLLTRSGLTGLTNSWTLIGIVSFGSRHCGGQVPTVLTRVSSYLDWIEEETRRSK